MSGASGGSPERLVVLDDYLYMSAYSTAGVGAHRIGRVQGTTFSWVPFPSNDEQYLDCDCYDPTLVATTTRLFVPVYSTATGHEFAYVEPNLELPSTSVDADRWSIAALVLLAALTAVAGATVLNNRSGDVEGVLTED